MTDRKGITMENKSSSYLREITLSDLWRIFVQRLWIMVLAMVIVMGSYITYDKLTYVPRYNSTATLYILKQQSELTTNRQDYEDFTLALKVVNDCNHMLKSHVVLDAVAENLGLNMSYGALRSSISTSNPEESRILEVTVEADTPENAKRIVDNICDVGVAKITEAMGFKQVNLIEYGILNTAPCNTTSVMSYALAGIVAMVFVYAIYLLRFLFDDRLKTDEEIEKALELTVIGDIPNADGHKNGKYGYYRYYGKYGYGKYGYGKYGRYSRYGYGQYGYGQQNTSQENVPEGAVMELEEVNPKKKRKKQKPEKTGKKSKKEN